ncbi:MAG: radical SAM family heme chaperone HemW [Muribaculaceae bacterium]|nr:radical SAM family heme chaperone HemW [Muribaculaceae bacterium]
MNSECPDSGGLYIHIAYCRRKCIYCDFFSAGERVADWHRYVDALIAELTHRKNELPCPLLTVYVGGGTPSLMPAEEFQRLADALRPYSGSVTEFTIEVNPDDVCEEKLMVWKDAGVNRLSIGIQTFDDTLLKTIGRRHDGEVARRALKLARQYFDNLSVDLMYGLPGQTTDIFKKDLEETMKIRPEHISAYSLMFEPGTALTLLRDKGKVQEVDDRMAEEMYLMLVRELTRMGYEHYEISNFALPGRRSRHNSSYWRQKPYLGIGPSAHSYDGERTRKANRADLRGYLDCMAPLSVGSDLSIEDITDREYLSDEELREEYLLTRLRTREGVDLLDFKRRFGEPEYRRLLSRADRWIKDGSVTIDETHLALTENSILISDSIIIDLA